MNPFFAVCNILYWTDKLAESYVPSTPISYNNESRISINDNISLPKINTSSPINNESSDFEKERTANKYGYSTGYVNCVNDSYQDVNHHYNDDRWIKF